MVLSPVSTYKRNELLVRDRLSQVSEVNLSSNFLPTVFCDEARGMRNPAHSFRISSKVALRV
jgi:hypothetical protein